MTYVAITFIAYNDLYRSPEPVAVSVRKGRLMEERKYV